MYNRKRHEQLEIRAQFIDPRDPRYEMYLSRLRELEAVKKAIFQGGC
jgi:hypothetical protein